MSQSEQESPAKLLEPGARELKADTFQEMLEKDGHHLQDTEVIESNDVNGPWVPTDDMEMNLKEEVEYVLDEVNLGDTHHTILTSGHPFENLRKVRDDRIGENHLGIVGELGSVYKNSQNIEYVHPEKDPRELFEIHRNLYDKAAEQKTKLLPQNNISNVVSCIRVEGEGRPGDERSGLYKDTEVTEQNTEDIAQELEDYDGFNYNSDTDRVEFENNRKNAAILTDTLRHEFRYPGIRFEETDDGRIAFYRDRKDDPGMTLEEAHSFVEETLPECVQYYVNDDWGVDIVTADEVSKGQGIRAYADEHIGHDNYIVTHVGDKASDIIRGDDAYNFPLQGSEAHRYCQDLKIPHIPVEDGAEYAEIMAEVADRK